MCELIDMLSFDNNGSAVRANSWRENHACQLFLKKYFKKLMLSENNPEVIYFILKECHKFL